ncbi:hypothetical protein RB195_020431 [Necator americanus]|uniref:Uncharacterized protein n=1 Tax=Necator americanus TaxID=51031 RepID=A0ABR1CIT2_NECAM
MTYIRVRIRRIPAWSTLGPHTLPPYYGKTTHMDGPGPPMNCSGFYRFFCHEKAKRSPAVSKFFYVGRRS